MTSEGAPFPNGTMRLYGLIGDPVDQVRVPHPATERFRQRGANAALLPMHVPAAQLEQIVAALKLMPNLDGLVVTVPHKIPMAGLVDTLSERSRLVGAINLARREADGSWSGDIVDGVGFRHGLAASGFDPAGQKAFIAGAGGVGSAIAVELCMAGAAVEIFDVSPQRAASLIGRLQAAGHDAAAVAAPDPQGATLVVNATPLGMAPGDPLPIDTGLLRPGTLVAEAVMKPRVTALLKAAEAAGCSIQLGEAVMIYQLDPMADFLLGATEASNQPIR